MRALSLALITRLYKILPGPGSLFFCTFIYLFIWLIFIMHTPCAMHFTLLTVSMAWCFYPWQQSPTTTWGVPGGATTCIRGFYITTQWKFCPKVTGVQQSWVQISALFFPLIVGCRLSFLASRISIFLIWILERIKVYPQWVIMRIK